MEVKNILHTHLAKIEVEQKSVCSLLCSTRMFNKSVFRAVAKKIAPITGFILVTTLLLFFLHQAIRLQESYVKYNGNLVDYFGGIMACFSNNIVLLVGLVLLFNSVICLLWSLMFSPGFQPRLRLNQEENVVNKICQEMDSHTSQNLTQLDELCLECLTEKYVHLEHCKSCNKCIRNFHLHSKIFNKCFGDRNVRGYILHQFFSFALSLVLIYLIGSTYWKDLTVDVWILKPV